jgi:hypothetical protein
MGGCVLPPPPYEEYTMARSAVQAAQEADSPRFAASLWSKADENYHKGMKAYKEAEFENAKKYFIAAKDFAERAENATRLKKFQTGESFP